jgi:hypothetical protein
MTFETSLRTLRFELPSSDPIVAGSCESEP